MYIIEALVGVGLLAFGRKLFWLFVAGVGFAAGLALTAALFKTSPAWEVLLIAFGAGLAGALLAVFLQRIAMGVGGFIGGGYILASLLNLLGIRPGLPEWILSLAGGILGAVLIFVLFDWMLILLSCLAGASMVAEALGFQGWSGLIVVAVLLVVGIWMQTSLLRREKRQARS